jgi:hypothetical protein
MASPRRGEVWLVDLGMAAKVRPAVVISVPAEDVDRALVTWCRTRQVRASLDLRQPSLCHSFALVCSTRRISSPFHTRNSCDRWAYSAPLNSGLSSARCVCGSAYQQAGQRPNKRLQPSAAVR